MATFNGGKYIEKQIESILPQLADEDEFIISDDSSTDHTIQIIKNYNDPRIRLYKNNSFRSPIYNFEYALKQSSGDIIFLADQDDIWHPDKVKIVSEFFASGYSLVVSDCEVIDDKGKVRSDSFFHLRNSGPGIFRNLYKNSYLGCCMAIKRDVLDKALPFPKNLPMHDMWLGLIADTYGKSFFCNQKLVQYRRHLGNHTPDLNESSFSIFQQTSIRIHLFSLVCMRYLKLI